MPCRGRRRRTRCTAVSARKAYAMPFYDEQLLSGSSIRHRGLFRAREKKADT